MAEKAVIQHEGIIQSVNGETVVVSIEASASCSSCAANSACGLSSSSKREVEVTERDNSYKPGDNVIVNMNQSLGYKAFFYGYLMPFLLLFFTIVIMISLGLNEGLSGLVAVLIIFPYYGSLYFLRGKLKKQFTFSITKNYFN